MGQRQHHRGRHPEDAQLFAPKWVPVLRSAVADLSYLWSRGYAPEAALKLVGDRFQLATRQRRAVERAACSDASLEYRTSHAVAVEALQDRAVWLDGYNVLITVESILAGGILLRGRDGCIRDMASVHGSYRCVEETRPAIDLLGAALQHAGVAAATWYFDAPVSNSARLRALFRAEAEQHGWPWQVELDNNPDKLLAAAPGVVITSDSWILDRAAQWANLIARIVRDLGLEASVVDVVDPVD